MSSRVAVLPILVGLLGGVGLVLARAPQAPVIAAGPAVSIVDFAFQPGNVTVVAGTVVTWTNAAATAQHTVTADDGSFDSGPLSPRDAFANLFDTAGTFTYHCTIHPEMHGTVVVKAAPATATPAGTPPPTRPPGTLPPDFHTPVPLPTESPTESPTALATPSLSPSGGSEGSSGSGDLSPIVVVAAIAAIAVAAFIMPARRRRRPRG